MPKRSKDSRPAQSPETDLSSLSRAELEALRRRVDERLGGDHRRRKEALKAVEAALKEFGYTLRDLTSPASAKVMLRAGRAAGPRYRNPDDPAQIWSGRGRQPRWFKAHMEAGKSPEDLRA